MLKTRGSIPLCFFTLFVPQSTCKSSQSKSVVRFPSLFFFFFFFIVAFRGLPGLQVPVCSGVTNALLQTGCESARLAYELDGDTVLANGGHSFVNLCGST